MTGLEVVAAVLGPVVAVAIKEIRSRLKNDSPSTADLHGNLNSTLGWLLDLQKDKHDEALSSNQRDTNTYKRWKEHVLKMKDKVNSLNIEYEEWKGEPWPVRKSKLGLKKKIKDALKEAIFLHEKCPGTTKVVDEVRERVIKEAGVKSIAKYRTLRNAFKEIRHHLKTPEVKCVALCGQRGVGKTTIMQHLNNHYFNDSSNNKKFDVVIFIKVAADKPIKEAADEPTECLYILQKIADRLNVGKEDAADAIAKRIRRELEGKSYLLILDGIRHKPKGIWDNLAISKDIDKDSKVVITTHYPLAVVKKYVDRKVELKQLQREEAWNMFHEIVGDDHLLPGDIEQAQLICEVFCCRLPLLIDRIANSFQKEAPVDWENTLRGLRTWPKVGASAVEELYQQLKICYDLLSPSKQKCFLYASQYPANSNIYTNYLVECCIVLGFFDGDRPSRSQVVNTILTHLINVSLLEKGEQMRYVKMNYFYWQLASYILSEDPKLKGRTFFDNGNHEEPPQDVIWFSRIGSESKHPPQKENCASLESLLLQKNSKLKFSSSGHYFESMSNLLVLNLYGTKIRKLPSLKGLKHLKALYLNGCSNLEIDRHEIERPLKHLEVLDVRDTKVDFVPCIKSLCCLRISYMALGNNERISELKKLEELTIQVKSQDLQEWCKNAQSIMGKVASLTKLTTFRCSFYSSEISEEFPEEASESWIREKICSLHLKFSYDVKT